MKRVVEPGYVFITQYICEKCNEPMLESNNVLMTNPSKYTMRCPKCGHTETTNERSGFVVLSQSEAQTLLAMNIVMQQDKVKSIQNEVGDKNDGTKEKS